MIKCLVVDDEQAALDVLRFHAEKVPFLKLVAQTTSPLKAVEILSSQDVDLVFLDIQMPELTGIDLIKTIRPGVMVVFTTAYSEYAVHGYELNIVDYLLKPVSFTRFMQAANKALTLQSLMKTQTPAAQDDFVFVKTEHKGKMLRIEFKDIDYVEGMRNYIAIHQGKQRILTLQNLKDMEDILPAGRFARIHRSFIVALDRIAGINGGMVILKPSGAELPLGESYRAAFMEKYKDKLL
jgi:DNA-binding LytR/AlgR family response regulator